MHLCRAHLRAFLRARGGQEEDALCTLTLNISTWKLSLGLLSVILDAPLSQLRWFGMAKYFFT